MTPEQFDKLIDGRKFSEKSIRAAYAVLVDGVSLSVAAHRYGCTTQHVHNTIKRIQDTSEPLKVRGKVYRLKPDSIDRIIKNIEEMK